MLKSLIFKIKFVLTAPWALQRALSRISYLADRADSLRRQLIEAEDMVDHYRKELFAITRKESDHIAKIWTDNMEVAMETHRHFEYDMDELRLVVGIPTRRFVMRGGGHWLNHFPKELIEVYSREFGDKIAHKFIDCLNKLKVEVARRQYGNHL